MSPKIVVSSNNSITKMKILKKNRNPKKKRICTTYYNLSNLELLFVREIVPPGPPHVLDFL